MELQCCLNGRRARTGGVPHSAAEFGWDGRDCQDAGATSAHIHPRDRGRDSISATSIARTVNAVRSAAPGLPVGVTTGEWIGPAAERIAAIESWTVLPDFASVNWSEEGAADLARALLARGVGVEAGLGSLEDARAWVADGIATLRVLIEVRSPLEADGIRSVIGDVPALVHGYDESAWPMLRYAIEFGLDGRIGFEDTLLLPDGTPAASNAELVGAALRAQS